jgi:hypothetical protein
VSAENTPQPTASEWLPLRIVTVNSHQPYLYLLAGLRHAFTVVDHGLRGFGCRWQESVRPRPRHFATVGLTDACLQARDRPFDVGLAHNVTDLLVLKELCPRLILLVHGTLEGRVANEQSQVSPAAFLATTRRYLDLVPAHVVYISPLKARSWHGLPGQVIPHGLPPDQYRGWSGELPAVLRVANMQRARDVLLGHALQQEVLRGLPNRLLGWNPDVPGAAPAQDWEDLKHCYRRHRCFLISNRAPLEDGFNLALLEAMATGMPVVSTPHPTSPVRHGENGLVGETCAELREHLVSLLQDRDLARKLGERARATVLEEFPYPDFLAAWDRLLHQVAAGKTPDRRLQGTTAMQEAAAPCRPQLTLLRGGAPDLAEGSNRSRPDLRPVPGAG